MNGRGRLAVQSEPMQDAIQDEGDPGHVARVLENGDQAEQNQENGYVVEQGNGRIHQPQPHGTQVRVVQESRLGQPSRRQIPGLGEKRPGHRGQFVALDDGQFVDRPNGRQQEQRRQPTVEQHPVDPFGQRHRSPAPIDQAGGDDVARQMVAAGDGVVGHRAFRRVLEHRTRDVGVVEKGMRIVYLGGQKALGLGVALEQLNRQPAGRDRLADFRMGRQSGLKDRHRFLQGAVIQRRRRNVHGVPDATNRRAQLVAPDPSAPDRGDHRHAEPGFQHLQVDLQAPALGHVHHVQDDDDRHSHLEKLEGQAEPPAQVRRVDHIDDHVGTVFEQEPPGDALLQRKGRQTVGAGQIDDLDPDSGVGIEAALLVDGHAGIVRDVLMHAGQHVEQGRLSRILLTRQGDQQAVFPWCCFKHRQPRYAPLPLGARSRRNRPDGPRSGRTGARCE